MTEVRNPRALMKEFEPNSTKLREKKRLNPLKASITLNNGTLSTADLTLSERDESLNQHDFVELYGIDGSFGIFRVVNRGKKFRNSRTYKLNHAIDTLNDAVINNTDTISGTVSEVITELLTYQMQKIGNDKMWKVGTIECTEDYSFDNDYKHVYEVLQDIADENKGYKYTYDFTTFPWTLNFVAKNPSVLSEFRLNRNIDEVEVTETDNDQCTRLFLTIKNDTSNTTTYRTIADNGAVAQWGVIDKAETIYTSEVSDTNEWIDQYINEHRDPEVTIRLTGEQYSRITGEPMDKIVLGGICKVILNEYSTIFNEIVESITYSDLIRKPQHFTAELANKKKTASGNAKSTAKTASSTAKYAKDNIKRLNYEFFSDYGYFRSSLEMTEQHLKTQFEDADNGLRSSIEQTAAYWRAQFDDMYNGLRGLIEQTAQYWRATYEDMYNGFKGMVEITAQYWRSTYEDMFNGLRGMIEQTAAYWRATFEDMYNGFKGIVEITAQYWRSTYEDMYNGFKSVVEQTAQYWRSTYEDMYNGFKGVVEQTAQYWRSTYEDMYNGFKGVVEQTAQYWRSTYEDMYNGFSGVVEQTAQYWRSTYQDMYNGFSSTVEQTAQYWRSSFEDSYNGIKSTVEQFANKWEARVVGIVDEEGNIHAANIAVAINEAGEGVATIDADKIMIGNEKSTTVIAGKCELSDVTADYISTKIANLSVVNMKSVSVSGSGANINCAGYIYGEEFVIGTNGSGAQSNKYMSNAITDLQIDQDGNTYTLQKKDFGDTDWVDVGNFSRAITSWTKGWSGGIYTATASPQSQGVTTRIRSIAYIDGENPARDGTLIHQKLAVNVSESGTDSPVSSGFSQDVYINAYDVYQYGWERCYAQIKLNYSSNQEIAPGGSRTVYPYSKPTPSGDGASIISKGITVSCPVDANLVAGNIKKDVAIYGITGTYKPTGSLSWNGSTGSSAGASNNISCTYSDVDYIKLNTDVLTVYCKHSKTASTAESGGGTVVAKVTLSDANLTAGNIKNGVTIFGVSGSYNPTATLSWNGSTGSSAGASNNISCSRSDTDYIKLTASTLTVYCKHSKTASTVEGGGGTTVAKITLSDSKLKAENIKNGVTIFGVSGTFDNYIDGQNSVSINTSSDWTTTGVYNLTYDVTGNRQYVSTTGRSLNETVYWDFDIYEGEWSGTGTSARKTIAVRSKPQGGSSWTWRMKKTISGSTPPTVTHSVSASGWAGPFNTQNDLKEALGVSDLTKLGGSPSSGKYYGFEVSCGGSKKYYYTRV